MANTIYFSRLRKMPVRDKKFFLVGRVEDLVIRDGDKHADVVGLVVKTEDGSRVMDSRFVESIEKCVYLSQDKNDVAWEQVTPQEFMVKNVLLDKQVIDVNGLKAVRVNDVLLTQEGNKLFVASVEVGIRGLLRRLGLKNLLKLPLLKSLKAHLIPWEQIEPLERKGGIKLKVERTKLNEIHPADLADLIEDLSLRERAMVFRSIDEDLAADAFVEANDEVQKEIFRTLEKDKLEDIIQKMDPHEIVDFVKLLPKERIIEVLQMLEKDKASTVKSILKYPEETAGSIMDTAFMSVPANVTASKAIALLRPKLKKTKAYAIFAVDSGGKLVGATHLRKIVAADPKKRVYEFMYKHTYRVTANDSLENVAKTMGKYDLIAMPVVDEKDRLIGMITVDDVFERLMPEDWKKGRFLPKHKKRKQ
ncbi:MAG: CBS domain-containing protein [Candidatus Micrarchaeota archaeon]